MVMEIQDAVRDQLLLRMLIEGPSGSGKTATALLFATALARKYGGKIGVIATEQKRDLIYAKTPFAPDGFQRIQLDGDRSVATYRAALAKFRNTGGFAVVVIDSLSHAWAGTGGLLEQVDSSADKGGNEFAKWREADKVQNRFMDDIIAAPFHVIATIRSKTESVMVPDESKPGKMKVLRVGMKGIQKAGIEYEFGIYCRMDEYHNMTVVKTDCSVIDRLEVPKPTMAFMDPIMDWLLTGQTPSIAIEGIRKASDEQFREYFQACRLMGHSEEETRAGFMDKYGMWIEDSPAEMLAERIADIKEKVAKKTQAASRRGGA